jgi:hypothetical protein
MLSYEVMHFFLNITTYASIMVINITFQALTAASIKIIAFWDTAPSSLGVDRRFEGAYCLHHHPDDDA